VTVADLPEGCGNTSRLVSLVELLSRSGHAVTILNQHALGITSTSVQRSSGEIAGGRFEYVLGTVDRYYGLKAIQAKWKAVGTIRDRILQLYRQKRVDLVWFNQLSFYDVYPLTMQCKKLGIPTIQSYEDERQELTSREYVSLSRRIFAINSRMADKWCPRRADAIIGISHYLIEKYARLSQDPNRVHLLPTIIDCNTWKCGPEPVRGVPTIVYSGFLGEQDEMEEFLLALRIVREEGLKFRFVMLGGAIVRKDMNERQARIQSQIEELGLADVVEQKGFVSRAEVRQHLEEASLLLAIRRDGVWSRSGLATKLSEYLASGRLVLTSDVGDVPKYLTNEKNALVLRGSCKAGTIAEALRLGLASRDFRNRVGHAGRQVALDNFDLPISRQRLDSVLHGIFSSRSAFPEGQDSALH